MSYDDDNFLAECLSQDLVLSLKTDHYSYPRNTILETVDPTFFLNLRPLRHDPSSSLSRIPHSSSFVSDSVYSFLADTLYSRGTYARTSMFREETDPTVLADKIREELQEQLLEVDKNYHLSAEQRRSQKEVLSSKAESRLSSLFRQTALFTKERDNFIANNAHSIFFQPFYLVNHPSECDRDGFPLLRALPILSPNLPLPFLSSCRFLADLHSTPNDRTSQIDQTDPYTFSPDRTLARLFVGLFLSPSQGAGRLKIAGWRTAERTKPTTFRFRTTTTEQREILKSERDTLRSARTEREAEPSESAPTNLIRRNKSRRVPTDDTTVITACDPTIDPQNEEYEFDAGAQAHFILSDLITNPPPIPLDLLPINSTRQLRVRDHKVRPAELPCDPDLGGFFAFIELPESMRSRFSEQSFSLEPSVRKLNAQQRRRLVNHTRRPYRPVETHCVVARSGLTRIVPSVSHLSLLLPPDVAPTEAMLRCRRVRSVNSQLVVRIHADTSERATPTISAGRAISSTTLSEELAESIDLKNLPKDPEKPNYFFLEEDPMLTDPSNPETPTRSGAKELTLVFRSYPYDYDPQTNPTEPNAPLPDGKFVLEK